MPGRIAAVLSFFALSFFAFAACGQKPDPLAAHRATCEKLQKAGQLKKGLAIDDCASQLKAAADASDPKLRSAEILDRLAALTAKGRGAKDESNTGAVRDLVQALQRL